MKSVWFSALCALLLAACQAPQIQGRAEFAPAGQPPQFSRDSGNHVGISNEGGSTRLYGSMGVEAQHRDGRWSAR